MRPGSARVARSPGCGPAPGRPRSGGRRLALAGTGLRSPPRPRPSSRSRLATPGRPCGDPPRSPAGSARATHHLEGTAGAPRRSPPPGRPPWSATSSRWCSMSVAASTRDRSSACDLGEPRSAASPAGTLECRHVEALARGRSRDPGDAEKPPEDPVLEVVLRDREWRCSEDGGIGAADLLVEVPRRERLHGARSPRRPADRWPRPRARAPLAAPRVAIALRLFASAGPRPLVRSRTCTTASKEDAVCTNRAAGRACSPCGFATVILVTTASPSGRSRWPDPRRRPGCRGG